MKHVTNSCFALVCTFVCLFCTAPLAHAAQKNQEKVTITLPKNSPRLQLLQQSHILVGQAKLPTHKDVLRTRWQEILKKHKQHIFDVQNIPLPAQHKQQWANLSRVLPNMEPLEKLRNINGFFNGLPSRKDGVLYNTKEYWATPYEFLQKRGGDCEDYAFTKLFALQYFDWPAEDLWVVLVHDKARNEGHAVVAARHKNRVFILDNLSKPVQLLIPESQYAKQVHIFGVLNIQGLWLPFSEK